jgi:hypothetical protein
MQRERRLGEIFGFSLILGALVVMVGLNLPAWGQEVFLTRYAVVRAASAADLLEMERRLHFTAPASSASAPTSGEYAFHPGFPRLAAKIDGILERAAGLINLSRARPPKVTLIVLPDGKEVRRQHMALVPGQRPGLFGYGSLEAFYHVSARTIYLSLADLREGILAHELTHHLLCTVMALPPPEQTQEAYAHYVESRL